MAILPIVIVPDPRLKQKAQPVTEVDARIARLMDDMLETMYEAPGIGLAAPQIGVLERVIVLDTSDKDETPNPIRMANPEVIWRSEEKNTYNEGCLSIPDQYADITRPAAVKVRYLDEKNRRQEIDADGLLSTCVQHEIDHLDGILFIDYLSSLKRNMMVRKVQKAQRQKTPA